MNTANPFKVGDLVSVRVTKYEAPNYMAWKDTDRFEPPKFITKIIARRVMKVRGEMVYLRIDKRLQGLCFRNVNRVY